MFFLVFVSKLCALAKGFCYYKEYMGVEKNILIYFVYLETFHTFAGR